MTDDLIAWLRAVWDERERELAEDERIARAAMQRQPGQWEVAGYDGASVEIAEPGEWAMVVYDEGAPLPEQAAHIARWDPDRVLRKVAVERAEIDAKRRIVRELERCGPKTEGHVGLLFAVQVIAELYADRPGFREEWRA